MSNDDTNFEMEEEGERFEEVTEPPDKERTEKIPVVIPYIKGFSQQLRLVFGRYIVAIYFRPTNTLRQLLVKPKAQVSKENVVGDMSFKCTTVL